MSYRRNDEEDENQLLVGDADQFAAAGEDAQEETGDEQHVMAHKFKKLGTSQLQ